MKIETTAGILTDDAYNTMVQNIMTVFNCKQSDVTNINPIQVGLSNMIFRFKIKHKGPSEFVYRNPGLGSELLTDRGRETIIQSIVSAAGVDPTLIAMDAKEGWRISKYIQHRDFDYHNINDMVQAIMLIKKIHEIPCKVRWNFDVIKEAERIEGYIPKTEYGKYECFEQIKNRCYRLYEYTKKDNIEKCITHGDCRDVNFLINDRECHLIDWEWGGFGDPGFDIGTYVCGGKHSQEEIERILFTYFRRVPTKVEKRHYYAYIALSGWFYMNWTMLKEWKGQKIGILKELWHHYANEYSLKAIEMYEVNE